MDVPVWVWLITIGGIVAMLAVDLIGHVRKPHAPTLRESAWWSVAYIAIALAFGLLVWIGWGAGFAGEYYAGYLTEKSLSVDNLFVFVLIMGSFAVPREYQQKVLFVGIIIALVLRTVFILLGAELVNNFSWIFYVFGAFLIWTAVAQARHTGHEGDEQRENALVRVVRRLLPTTEDYVGDRIFVRHDHRWHITPMLVVMVAIGSADILFAVDSIPAIFGLTQEVYLIFAANAFSLLGLRQLFFLIDGLLDRLVYLNYGLAAILAFIGAKLVIHAMHENELPFINGGEHIEVIPEIPTALSLVFIVVTLAITTVASLIKSRSDAGSRSTDA
ncbi:Integral membrane protein TerC [Beutenbergia cavernae DSM 12333]|uniref:Integral membrane protein TerC n=1 Tax=Beutenbergia cavernae (strain ATCC BAA-8 / DSM 12333 / CCUG 43141 / JCM 11478 / NBRC 16432 / NCIMB 13614 / HKI 0122) TaxID=471853 RepID=C5BV48_BEUC1|nr:TerC family protein [Beutenbergia cavernae]ACQ80435.1 Integral membrane protein TerC [Beutenbergia cavernae DSM 12333]